MADRVLVFMLGDYRLALPAACVRECLPLPRLRRRPGQPDAVAGFFSFGRTTLPVVDLARLLGLRSDPAPRDEDGLYCHLLRLDSVTLLVDRATGFAEAAAAPADMAPDPWQHRCVSRRVLVEDEPVMLLDPGLILRQDEQARLNALAEAARSRAGVWGEPEREGPVAHDAAG